MLISTGWTPILDPSARQVSQYRREEPRLAVTGRIGNEVRRWWGVEAGKQAGENGKDRRGGQGGRVEEEARGRWDVADGWTRTQRD